MNRLARFWDKLWTDSGFGWRILRMTILLIVLLVAAVKIFEDRLIYFPTRYPHGGEWETPTANPREGEVFAEIEDCWFQAADGTELNAWYGTASKRIQGSNVRLNPRPVLLFFHGNAGNIASRREDTRLLAALPADTFMIDYRGYGKSDGHPSESGLYLDAAGIERFSGGHS